MLFINNAFVDAVSGRTFPTINPATEDKIADVAEADKADVDKAVESAKAAFKRGSVWRNLDASGRGKLIYKLAELIDKNVDYLASLETLDNGKPYEDSIFDLGCASDTFRYFAGWCDKIEGSTIPSDGPYFTYTRKEPVGIVGQIIPWNYPVLMLAWKWGPALAAGCPVLLKPAEQTPLTALYVAALTQQAGFPDGVISVLPGYGPTAGAAIASHPDISKVAFTGSTEVGHSIMAAAAASNLKRVSLELGGKSPLVICADADVDMAVEIAHNAIFANHGQNCSRTYVQEDIYDTFVKKAAEKAAARKVGDPFDKSVQQGPQVDAEMFTKVLNYIKSGVEQGGKLEAGGKRKGDKGYFIEPTVFSNVTDDFKIAREEIFGPVQTIIKFKTLDEVIERANDTKYGLASGIVTTNIDTANTFAHAINAGSVWINCYDAVVPQAPFGGFKESGIGRELGKAALDEYTELKTVTTKITYK
ncbi:hypothetical protein M8J76_009541 [Diaphorina citri]|nr:hypothetical protein M8J75_011225 [Diaphorina citri]KAI5730058.1 hypothetical protein M8J76_009541 [Diaphorina citri]